MNKKMPYFDYLLAGLDKGSASLEKSFGLHVHWGYWPQPKLALFTPEDYLVAAEALTSLIYSSAQISNGQRILDVGCGFGGTIDAINKAFQNMELVGLNIDERQLERARQQIFAVGENSIEFQQGDACALPFADNSFDVVLAVECIFHFPSRELFFQEAYRVLKPGGYLALSDFLLNKNVSKLDKRIGLQSNGNQFFGSCNVDFTVDAYRQLAQSMQFEIELAKNITSNSLPTYQYLKLLIKPSALPRLKRMGILATIGFIELLSKLRLLNYFVFAFKKPQI